MCKCLWNHAFSLYLILKVSFYLFLQVLIPLISNRENQNKWPQVVTQDITRHTGALKGDVFTLSGQVKGRTLLPLPAQTDLLVQAAELQAE